MKAENTEMTDPQIEKLKNDTYGKLGKDADLSITSSDKAIVTVQAKITWDKAIQEVVKWVSETDILIMLSPRKREEWQAKLKEWGFTVEEQM